MTTLLLKWEDWQQGLTSCSIWLKLQAPKFTPGSLRQRLKAWQRPQSCPWNSSTPISTDVMRRGQPAMVGLQGLHSSDTFWHLNVWAGVGLKLFCLWCFKFVRNTETTATLLREVHYKLAIACDICQSFANMSVQVVLEHRSKCWMKSHRKSKMKAHKVSVNESCRVAKHLILSIWSSHGMWICLVIQTKGICIWSYRLLYPPLPCLQCPVSCNIPTVL